MFKIFYIKGQEFVDALKYSKYLKIIKIYFKDQTSV